MRAYHERELGSLRTDNLTFGAAAMQYLAHGTKDLARRTLKDYTRYLTGEKRLLAVFGECPFDAIEPHHVKQYHRRAKELRGSTQANREKAALSLLWNWARAEGLTKLPNPCQGIRGAARRGSWNVG